MFPNFPTLALFVYLFEMHFPPLSLTKKFSQALSWSTFQDRKREGTRLPAHTYFSAVTFSCAIDYTWSTLFFSSSLFSFNIKSCHLHPLSLSLSRLWKPLLSGISFKWTRNLNTRSTLICHENYVSIALRTLSPCEKDVSKNETVFLLRSITTIFHFNRHHAVARVAKRWVAGWAFEKCCWKLKRALFRTGMIGLWYA